MYPYEQAQTRPRTIYITEQTPTPRRRTVLGRHQRYRQLARRKGNTAGSKLLAFAIVIIAVIAYATMSV